MPHSLDRKQSKSATSILALLRSTNHSTTSPKHLKGSWTHSPHKKFVAKALDHLQACRTLLRKVTCVMSDVLNLYLTIHQMQERLLEAYRFVRIVQIDQTMT